MVRKRYAASFIFCLLVFIFGFLTVSSNLPKFIKEKSKFNISFSVYPFDFQVYTDKYHVYANSKALTNIKDGSIKILNNLEGKIEDAFNFMHNDVVK